VTVHDQEAIELTADLIRIDSANPDLAPGSAGEGAIADFVSDWLSRNGFTVTRLESRPGRPSVVAVAPGSGGGRSLMLNGHLDTVSLLTYEGNPLEPVIRDGGLHGRGAYDMKSGLAAMMCAAARASRHPHRGDIVLALVADEENASLGTEEVLDFIGADAAVVCEPSGLEVTVAHKGFCWLDVTIHGRAAHGSRPDLGIDAIVKAGGFLTGLGRLAGQLAAGPAHPRLGTGSVHAGVVSGGQEVSSYPDHCLISVERRTVPGESGATAEAELRSILDDLSAADAGFGYTLTLGLERMPFEVAEDTAIVGVVMDSFAAVTGRKAAVRAEAFWTDCALLAESGVPSVLFGVEGGGAHAGIEWVTLESLTLVTETLTEVIRRHCG
jgi:acetylornithine deacetylase